MADIDNIKFSTLTFSYHSGDVYSIQATFQLAGGLLLNGYNQPVYNQFVLNFSDSGSDSLNGEISFSAELDAPSPNPDWQNAVNFKFLDLTSGASASKKSHGKIRGNNCPPPGAPTEELVGVLGSLDDYGARIKTVIMQRTGGDTQVTITTENINGEPTGYRIVGNMEHIIETGSGPVHTWAFEIEEDKIVDADNVFQFDFSSVDAEVGLPILFYAKGTDVNDVHQSDALLWIEQ
ncbi:hypothetical protein [Owenweeksia hongkongensis]|uniref:hypothetical protein n=1 Tax=Owenweeksia hongkongensis TaxID=253245 RepID=UPI003A90D6FF